MKKQILLIAFVCISILANAQWQLTGNSGTSFFNFLGTTDVAHLRFRTNNVQRMIITNQGKVGIGTGTPEFQFEVKGGSISVDSMYRIAGEPVIFNQTNQSNLYLFRDIDSITTGGSNILIGPTAGTSLNTGGSNFFAGHGTGFTCTSGGGNVAIGNQAGVALTTGSENVCLGRFAGNVIFTGERNVMLGNLCRGNINTSNSIALGYESIVASENSVAIGSGAVGSTNNKIRLGNTAITKVEGQVAYSFPSDGRFKTNVNENIPGMTFINKLRPVTYNFQAKKFDEFLHHNDKDYIAQAGDYNAAEEIIQSGFIAQEVEFAAKGIGYNFNGVNAPQHDYDNYSMSYELLVVPIVKGMQELDAENKNLKSENEELKNRLNKIEELLNISTIESTADFKKVVLNSDEKTAMLFQNLPNPFDNSTIIPFRIPRECHSVTIIITASTGKIVRAIPVSCKETQLSLEAGALAAGVYSYSLIVDGITVETRQMILSK